MAHSHHQMDHSAHEMVKCSMHMLWFAVFLDNKDVTPTHTTRAGTPRLSTLVSSFGHGTSALTPRSSGPASPLSPSAFSTSICVLSQSHSTPGLRLHWLRAAKASARLAVRGAGVAVLVRVPALMSLRWLNSKPDEDANLLTGRRMFKIPSTG
jgi:hypothetical protein